MVRLRTAGLSVEYRKNRRDAGICFLNFLAGLGRRLRSVKIACRWSIIGWNVGYNKHMKRNIPYAWSFWGFWLSNKLLVYQVLLLRNTWPAVRGRRSLIPSRARVPFSAYRMECLVLVCFSRGFADGGLARRQWLAAGLGSIWLAFTCLLRPGELMNLRCGDTSLPEEGDEEGQVGAVGVIRRTNKS